MPAAASRTSSENSAIRVASGIRSIVVSFITMLLPRPGSQRRAHILDSLDHAIQNGLDASDFASKRETPISRRIQSLRVINSLRERARRRHSTKQRFTSLQHEKRNVRAVLQFIVLTPARMAIAAGNAVCVLLSIVIPPHESGLAGYRGPNGTAVMALRGRRLEISGVIPWPSTNASSGQITSS